MQWLSSASISFLRKRSSIINRIRNFFNSRNFTEIETPMINSSTVTDQYINSLLAYPSSSRYLQTSPEHCMKRLISAGSGSLYQICRAFRMEESGNIHNPEFTMLEWYRTRSGYYDAFSEIDEFLLEIGNFKESRKVSYQSLLDQCSMLDSVEFDLTKRYNLEFKDSIEPYLGIDRPCIVYDFPSKQPGLSELNKENNCFSKRFELYIFGMEMANGFYELTNAVDQRNRMRINRKERKIMQSAFMPGIDSNFMASTAAGLASSYGIAFGIDRLIMSLSGRRNISESLSFGWDFS